MIKIRAKQIIDILVDEEEMVNLLRRQREEIFGKDTYYDENEGKLMFQIVNFITPEPLPDRYQTPGMIEVFKAFQTLEEFYSQRKQK